MIKALQLILILGLAAISTGCTSTYMADRGRDVADIFTATVGDNYGAKVRVGPLRAGLFCGLDYAGIRAGELGFPFKPKGYEEDIDLEITFLSAENFCPADLVMAKRRGKLFMSEGMMCFALPKTQKTSARQQIPYYTQIEVAAGFFGGIRLGVNSGELLDFVLGWATIDIFNDDIKESETEERN